jgi:glycosyltransferase involved in cell wall biosynthesis/ubiquinone/menaquinone biosynthesis C-methylase UbiE
MESVLYVGANLATVGVVSASGLAATTERHRLPLDVPLLAVNPTPLAELDRRPDLIGVIIRMERGWVGSAYLRFATRVLKRGLRVWMHWPNEEALECLNRERIRSLWRHWFVIKAFSTARGAGVQLKRRGKLLKALLTVGEFESTTNLDIPRGNGLELAASEDLLRQLKRDIRRVPFPQPSDPAEGVHRIGGLGVYLRTDYWVSITSGGSYGHTCSVAKELAARTDQFICFMANRYPLLDDFGLHQVVLPRPSEGGDERAILSASPRYYATLKVAFEVLKPSYIYERLCLGSYAGALLSRDLGIPYIVEYNGSEISMKRSFDKFGYMHETLFISAEDAAFQQATMITVVSRVIKDSLILRGVDPAKILVNPNGADPNMYVPPPAALKRAVREELGFHDRERVVGFSGTFGGWHGIDVLAAAIPRICERSPDARFLLIGDGSQKAALDAEVARQGLESRVKSVGRVPQAEGARLLAACDLYVCPHNTHMIDSRFFGSPTKLFEYMSMGGGIVASDLEQLGEVLSPALRARDFEGRMPPVNGERAILCAPGDVEEFVSAVIALIEHPALAETLGRNARQAVIDCHSWERHVGRIWNFIRNGEHGTQRHPRVQRVETGDAYKDEIQNQWDHNPAGSHYAKTFRPHTLEWFLEVERYRYGEYAPWMPEVMEFAKHSGEDLLEIGAGLGTDLSQFARHGARVTDVDLSVGHLEHAQENFALRGLSGRFVHHDAEDLPFDDNTFDVVYGNGVLHHTPNTRRVVEEIRRVLRPGGRVIVMMYAENSLHYWRQLVWKLGIRRELLRKYSIGEIMSRHAEITQNDARPLVKVYTAARLRTLFDGFEQKVVYRRQMLPSERPDWLAWVPVDLAGRLLGWNLIIKATKPRT